MNGMIAIGGNVPPAMLFTQQSNVFHLLSSSLMAALWMVVSVRPWSPRVLGALEAGSLVLAGVGLTLMAEHPAGDILTATFALAVTLLGRAILVPSCASRIQGSGNTRLAEFLRSVGAERRSLLGAVNHSTMEPAAATPAVTHAAVARFPYRPASSDSSRPRSSGQAARAGQASSASSQREAGSLLRCARGSCAAPGPARARTSLQAPAPQGHRVSSPPPTENSIEIDPKADAAYHDLCRAYELRGSADEADRVAARCLAETGRTSILFLQARLCIWRHDVDRARSLLGALAASEQFTRTVGQLLEHFVAGSASADDLRAISPARPAGAHVTARSNIFGSQLMAEMACHVGHHSMAVAALNKAVDAGLLDLGWLDRCPSLAAIRDRPEFAAARVRVEERARRVIAAHEAPLEVRRSGTARPT